MNRYAWFLLLAICTLHTPCAAQATWPSPEVEQMYNQARDYMSIGNVKQAIILYQQAIPLAPDNPLLFRDLGKAYYLNGNYPDAHKTLESVIKTKEADAQTFQIMAACETAAIDPKAAKSTLEKGLKRFPNSGMLYHDLGKYQEDAEDYPAALTAWLDGIERDPVYYVNYYEATRIYSRTSRPVWAILYGELFVNIESQTPRAEETRKMVMDAYRRIYNTPGTTVPEFKKVKAQQVNTFEDAVYTTLLHLAPLVLDGITTENLTMLRTRFQMDWFQNYGNQYPFTLFTYQDNMTRSGFFDVYNEWLFGKTENKQLYDSWNKFHAGAMQQFTLWKAQHKLVPATSDFYNDKKMNEVFPKNKK
jgi:tetratricopeptide (TPR) repeat protein